MANKQAAEIERALIGLARTSYIWAVARQQTAHLFERAQGHKPDDYWYEAVHREYSGLADACADCARLVHVAPYGDDQYGEPPSWEWCQKHGGEA